MRRWEHAAFYAAYSLATEEKSDQITAIPELIDDIDLRGATVTIDAA